MPPGEDNPFAFHLQPNEQLLWTGKPVTSPHLVPSDLWFGLVGIVMIILSLMIERLSEQPSYELPNSPDAIDPNNLLQEQPGHVSAFAIILFIFALYVMFGRPLVRALLAKNVRYGTTNMRAIAIRKGLLGQRSMTEVPLSPPPPVTVKASRDGRGSLVIGKYPLALMNPAAGQPGWITPLRLGEKATIFWNISDPGHVQAILVDAVAKAQRPSVAA